MTKNIRTRKRAVLSICVLLAGATVMSPAEGFDVRIVGHADVPEWIREADGLHVVGVPEPFGDADWLREADTVDRLDVRDAENDAEQEEAPDEDLERTAAPRVYGPVEDDAVALLAGPEEGEYLEMRVSGTIYDVEHVVLAWDEETNSLVEIEVLNRIELIRDGSLLLKTYFPEGIPREKIRWYDAEGKLYRHLVQEAGIGDRVWTYREGGP